MPTSIFREPAAEVRVDGGTLKNEGPAILYYRDELPVSADLNDGALAPGANVTLGGSQWLVSADRSVATIIAAPPATSTAEPGDSSVSESTLSPALKATLVIGRVYDGANYPERKDDYALNHWVGPIAPPDFQDGDVWTPTA